MAQKKGNNKKDIYTGVAVGTVVGASLGVAAAALSDKKTRHSLAKKGSAATAKAKKTVASLPKTMKSLSTGTDALLTAGKKRVAKKSSAGKKKLSTTTKKTTRSQAAKLTTKKAKK